jgi:hypothetical protein
MNLNKCSDEYLKRTYCHLIRNVRPQNEKNMNDFPPASVWEGIAKQIDAAIKAIDEEMQRRNIVVECK